MQKTSGKRQKADSGQSSAKAFENASEDIIPDLQADFKLGDSDIGPQGSPHAAAASEHWRWPRLNLSRTYGTELSNGIPEVSIIGNDLDEEAVINMHNRQDSPTEVQAADRLAHPLKALLIAAASHKCTYEVALAAEEVLDELKSTDKGVNPDFSTAVNEPHLRQDIMEIDNLLLGTHTTQRVASSSGMNGWHNIGMSRRSSVPGLRGQTRKLSRRYSSILPTEATATVDRILGGERGCRLNQCPGRLAWFGGRRELDRHELDSHSDGVRRLRCPLCSLEAMTKDSLSAHIDASHADEECRNFLLSSPIIVDSLAQHVRSLDASMITASEQAWRESHDALERGEDPVTVLTYIWDLRTRLIRDAQLESQWVDLTLCWSAAADFQDDLLVTAVEPFEELPRSSVEPVGPMEINKPFDGVSFDENLTEDENSGDSSDISGQETDPKELSCRDLDCDLPTKIQPKIHKGRQQYNGDEHTALSEFDMYNYGISSSDPDSDSECATIFTEDAQTTSFLSVEELEKRARIFYAPLA